MQNPDIISFENSVDPDQLASAQGTLFITANKYFLHIILKICLFVFVALRPMSTAMVIAGLSVHLTTLFPGQALASR